MLQELIPQAGGSPYGLCCPFMETTKWGFPKIRGTLLRARIIRNIVFWGIYWGPPILGNYQIFCTSFGNFPPSGALMRPDAS